MLSVEPFSTQLNCKIYIFFNKKEHIEKNIPMTVMGVFGLIGAVGLLLMKNKSLNLDNAADEAVTDELK